MSEFATLLKEYKNIFLQSFTKTKGINKDSGEMKIDLHLQAKLVKHHPYKLNPKIKQKVKKELNHMLVVALIFHVKESKWISPIVIKNDLYNIRVCANLRTFLVLIILSQLFNDEVLE